LLRVQKLDDLEAVHASLGKVVSRSLLSALLAACAGAAAQMPYVYHLQGDYAFTHDPSIAQDGATYYVFAIGKVLGGGQFLVRCSEDLEHWRMCGHVFDAPALQISSIVWKDGWPLAALGVK